MLALAPLIFAIDSNPRPRAKCGKLPFWFAPSSKPSGWKRRRSKMIQLLANALVPIFDRLRFQPLGFEAFYVLVIDDLEQTCRISKQQAHKDWYERVGEKLDHLG